MTACALTLATAFGLGRIPFAPGTFGSAAGLLLWVLLPSDAALQLSVTLLVFIVGTWAAGVTERHYRTTDPGVVVIDEVLGMMVTLLINPVSWGGLLVGFLYFRLFDVVKPYPANRFERLHGGLGVMADDAMAGVYANVALRMTLWVAPQGWM